MNILTHENRIFFHLHKWLPLVTFCITIIQLVKIWKVKMLINIYLKKQVLKSNTIKNIIIMICFLNFQHIFYAIH